MTVILHPGAMRDLDEAAAFYVLRMCSANVNFALPLVVSVWRQAPW